MIHCNYIQRIVIRLCFLVLSLFLFSCMDRTLYAARYCMDNPSSCVEVGMHSTYPSFRSTPIVQYQGEENLVCRKGLPYDYIPPWTKKIRREEDEDPTAPGDTEEEPDDTIRVDVADRWFKVVPLIANNTPYYLTITDINFKISAGGSGERQEKEESFSSGSYCNTDPLYYFEPRGSSRDEDKISYTLIEDLDKKFHMGNMVLFIGGLPDIEQNNDSSSSGGSTSSGSLAYRPIRIPNYTVYWQMLGHFREAGGEYAQVAGFQKTGFFSTRSFAF